MNGEMLGLKSWMVRTQKKLQKKRKDKERKIKEKKKKRKISQSNSNHFKNTTVVHFSAFVDLATEVSAILPLWRLNLSVYFHLGEYY